MSHRETKTEVLTSMVDGDKKGENSQNNERCHGALIGLVPAYFFFLFFSFFFPSSLSSFIFPTRSERQGCFFGARANKTQRFCKLLGGGGRRSWGLEEHAELLL